eukprot:415715-Alexandrium_andersonii.AAC.1
MSASLVGSEMCIRDSNHITGTAQTQHKLSTSTAQAEHGLRAATALASPRVPQRPLGHNRKLRRPSALATP